MSSGKGQQKIRKQLIPEEKGIGRISPPISLPAPSARSRNTSTVSNSTATFPFSFHKAASSSRSLFGLDEVEGGRKPGRFRNDEYYSSREQSTNIKTIRTISSRPSPPSSFFGLDECEGGAIAETNNPSGRISVFGLDEVAGPSSSKIEGGQNKPSNLFLLFKCVLAVATILAYAFSGIIIGYANEIPHVQFDFQAGTTRQDLFHPATLQFRTECASDIRPNGGFEFRNDGKDGSCWNEVLQGEEKYRWSAARPRQWAGWIHPSPAMDVISLLLEINGNIDATLTLVDEDTNDEDQRIRTSFVSATIDQTSQSAPIENINLPSEGLRFVVDIAFTADPESKTDRIALLYYIHDPIFQSQNEQEQSKSRENAVVIPFSIYVDEADLTNAASDQDLKSINAKSMNIKAAKGNKFVSAVPVLLYWALILVATLLICIVIDLYNRYLLKHAVIPTGRVTNDEKTIPNNNNNIENKSKNSMSNVDDYEHHRNHPNATTVNNTNKNNNGDSKRGVLSSYRDMTSIPEAESKQTNFAHEVGSTAVDDRDDRVTSSGCLHRNKKSTKTSENDATTTTTTDHTSDDSSRCRANDTPSLTVMCLDMEKIILSAPISVGWGLADVFEVIALGRLDPVVYGVISQTRLLATALLAKIILNRTFTSLQWIILLVLTFLVTSFSIGSSSSSRGAGGGGWLEWIGVAGKIILAVICAIYAERYYKTDNVAPFIVLVFHVSVVATPVCLLAVFASVLKPNASFFTYGFFGGYDFGWDHRTITLTIFYSVRFTVTGYCGKCFSALTKSMCNAVSLLVLYFADLLLTNARLDPARVTLTFAIVSIVTLYAKSKEWIKKPVLTLSDGFWLRRNTV